MPEKPIRAVQLSYLTIPEPPWGQLRKKRSMCKSVLSVQRSVCVQFINPAQAYRFIYHAPKMFLNVIVVIIIYIFYFKHFILLIAFTLFDAS